MERIILIAQQLSKEGKVPNTALIKSRLPKNVPLPVIIQGLKMWKENPQKEINIANLPSTQTGSEESINFDGLLDAKIKQALAPLLAEIENLQTQVKRLQQQLTTQEQD
ncbi:MAG: hypothetical protein ACJAT7_000855 [Psychromonas sp.]|jgi:hypothetical protein|uniref:hypothetical protein n=1 Tax=Psychromonas sp. TaxID=1884585 RepID=UPI0039E3FA13